MEHINRQFVNTNDYFIDSKNYECSLLNSDIELDNLGEVMDRFPQTKTLLIIGEENKISKYYINPINLDFIVNDYIFSGKSIKLFHEVEGIWISIMFDKSVFIMSIASSPDVELYILSENTNYCALDYFGSIFNNLKKFASANKDLCEFTGHIQNIVNKNKRILFSDIIKLENNL